MYGEGVPRAVHSFDEASFPGARWVLLSWLLLWCVWACARWHHHHKRAHTTKKKQTTNKEYVLAEVLKAGFKAPTPIQAQGWPMALLGRDLVGLAETGSGKTLAYLLPAVVHINAQPYLERGDGPIVLVLAPTRELAVQIKEEADKFGSSSRVKNTCVYGGMPKEAQIKLVRAGVSIVVATPGRLRDLSDEGSVDLSQVL